MRFSGLLFGILGTMGVIWSFSMAVAVPIENRPPRVESKADLAPKTAVNLQEQADNAFLRVQLFPGRKLTVKDEELQKRLATILSKFADLPAERAAFFAEVNVPPASKITGWGASIRKVEQTADGYLVTLKIMPYVLTESYGSNTILSPHDYYEQFQVGENGTFNFVKSIAPHVEDRHPIHAIGSI